MTDLIQVDSRNFEQEVLKAPQPVVVDFWAPSCGVCRRMEPIVREVAHVFSGEATVALCNVAEAPDIAQRYEVMASPTLAFFKNGTLVDSLTGYIDAPHLQQKLREVLAA